MTSTTILFSKDLSDSEEEEEIVIHPAECHPQQSEVVSIQNQTTTYQPPLVNPPKKTKPILTALVQITSLYHLTPSSSSSSSLYEIDNLILALMELSDEYHRIQTQSLQKHLSDGFFHASLAKYKQSSFSVSFPSTENIRLDIQPNCLPLPQEKTTEEKEKGDALQEITNLLTNLIQENKGNASGSNGSSDEDDEACGFKLVGSVEGNRSPRSNKSTPLKDISEEKDGDEAKEETTLEGKIAERDSEGDGVCYRLETKLRLEDYLVQFHGLPSTKLKQCQKDFYEALSTDILQLANIKQQMFIVCNLLEKKINHATV